MARSGLLAALCITLTSLLVPSTVVGLPAGTPQSVDELLDRYGVASSGSDFVVVVDTSGSMMGPPAIYPDVVTAYQRFVDAIAPSDNLSTITFDTVPNTRFSGPVATGDDRRQARDILPAVADGAGTDIGAAVASALDRLERPGSSQVQTLVFLTDGLIEAPAGSPYADPRSAAWDRLAERGHRVADGHTLVVYGAGLGSGTTDIDVLRRIFPRTEIVSLPGNQLSEFFEEAAARARIERLRRPVTDEQEQGYVAVDVEPGELSSPSHLTLRLRSTYPVLGAQVIVHSVAVHSADDANIKIDSALEGGQQTIRLDPGAISGPLNVSVATTAPTDSRLLGAVTTTQPLRVEVNADVRVEPADLLGRTLGIDTSGRLQQPDTVAVSRTTGYSWAQIAAALAALCAVLLLLFWIYRRFLRTPHLHSALRMADDQVVPLHGKRMRVPSREVDVGSFDGSEAELFTQRGKFRKRVGLARPRRPRIYVRPISGNCSVRKFGPPEPIQTTVEVLNQDRIIVGRASFRLTTPGQQ